MRIRNEIYNSLTAPSNERPKNHELILIELLLDIRDQNKNMIELLDKIYTRYRIK